MNLYTVMNDEDFQGDCHDHGPFHVMGDTFVPTNKHGDPQRDMMMLPPGLEVRESGIPGVELGVFATQFFPTSFCFHPYQDIVHSSGYCWQTGTHKGDTKDCNTGNWMKYVNCARTRNEQNVTAYLHCGEVYYRANCDIQPGTEILVWYGTECTKELGIIRDDCEERGRRESSITMIDCCRSKETEEQLIFSESDAKIKDIEVSDSEGDITQCKDTNPNKVKKQGAVSMRTPQLSTSDRTSEHKSSNPYESLLPLNRSHVCQSCSAAFVSFKSLKLHMAFVHGEKLQAMQQVLSTLDRCSDDNRSILNFDKKFGDGKTVEKEKDTAADRKTEFQKQGAVSRRTPHLSTSDRTSKHKSSNASGSLLPLNIIHVCKRCSAAFVALNSLKLHMAFVHGEKLKAMQQVLSTLDKCSDDNHSILNIDKKVGNLGDGKTVEKEKDTAADRKAEVRGKDKVDNSDPKKIDLKRKKSYVCDMCSKVFRRVRYLRRHKLIHTNPKQFVCDVCSKGFHLAYSLRRHKLFHTSPKEYVCDVCSKAFIQAGYLNSHKRCHTSLRQFVCDICSNDFKTAGHLKQHKLIHTSLKQFVCDVCSKAYSTASNLKRHKLIHINLKQ